MPLKRKRESSPDTMAREAAEAAIRRLITHFNIDPTLLEPLVEDDVSEVNYAQAAPLVGLNPDLELTDISMFEIHRSRIPTDLFKSIVMDMDVMLMQYGPPYVHKTAEAQSRFFSPIFNHLVRQFTFMLRNVPETIVDGQTGTRGRVQYLFKAFGAVAILCIEMRLSIGNEEERLNGIAQVIAECCDLDNAKRPFSLPILCILSDGSAFEFFKFERDGSEHLRHGLVLPDTGFTETPLPLILQLRRICETIFDMMLSAYVSALRVHRDRSASSADKREGRKRPSFHGWDQALKFAVDTLETFRNAEKQRKNGDVDSADVTVREGLRLLHESTGAVSTMYESKLLMTGWDEDEVKKA